MWDPRVVLSKSMGSLESIPNFSARPVALKQALRHSLEITTSLKYHNIVISPMYAVDMLAKFTAMSAI
jgi:hypothetical protein